MICVRNKYVHVKIPPMPKKVTQHDYLPLWRWRRAVDSWLTYSTRSTSSEGKGIFVSLIDLDAINKNGWYSTIRRYLVQTRAQYEYVYRCCLAFLEGRLGNCHPLFLSTFLVTAKHLKHFNSQDEEALTDRRKPCLVVLLFVNVILLCQNSVKICHPDICN